MMLGISVARNRSLANVFYRLTLIEAYGVGMTKIMRNYENFAIKPQIEVTDNAFKITLPSTNKAAESAALNENERVIIALFESKDVLVRKNVEATLSVSQTMAVRVLERAGR